MKLSMWNFKDWYQKHGLDCSYQISGNRIAIESVEFGSRSSVKDTDPSVAYIIPGEYLGHLCRSALCCAGDIIQFPAASENEVMNQSLELIASCRTRTESLMDCIVKNQPLEELLNTASRPFSFAMKLIFRDSPLEYQTDGWDLPLSWTAFSSAPKDEDATSPSFCTLRVHGHPRTVLQRSLSYKGKHVGALIAGNDNDAFNPGDFAFFEEILEILELYLNYHMQENEAKSPLDAWFAAQLSGDFSAEGTHPEPLAIVGWDENDSYTIAAVRGSENTTHSSSLFTNLFSEQVCCAAIHKTLFVLIRLGRDTKKEDLRKKLQDVAASHSLRIGISLIFRGFSDLTEFAKQAEKSVPPRVPGRGCAVFTEDHLREYILEACGDIAGLKSYISPALTGLASSHADNSPDDITILYTFLILGCSVTHTSARLYLHRNTLSSRLSHIRRRLGETLESTDRNRDLLTWIITVLDRTDRSEPADHHS